MDLLVSPVIIIPAALHLFGFLYFLGRLLYFTTFPEPVPLLIILIADHIHR
jgi:hypothetical protein